MKLLPLAFVLNLASFSGIASNHERANLPTDSKLTQASEHERARFVDLTGGICSRIAANSDGIQIAEQLEQFLVQHISVYSGKLSTNIESRNAEIIEYLNKNKNSIKCMSQRNGTLKNYMLVAIENGTEKALFVDLFIKRLNHRSLTVETDWKS